MDNSKLKKEEELQDYIKELVTARVKAISDELEISAGGKNLTKKQILESIDEENELGKEIIEMQLKFLRDISNGKIYDFN